MQMRNTFLVLIIGAIDYCSARQVSHERAAPLLDSPFTEANAGHGWPHSGFEQQWQQCGTWQDDYRNLHNEILAGDAAQMYLIAEPPAGLADSLACIGTLLYVSVLTDRAFLIRDTGGSNSILRFGFEQSHIKWAANPDALDLLTRVRTEELRSSGLPPAGKEADRIRCFRQICMNLQCLYAWISQRQFCVLCSTKT